MSRFRRALAATAMAVAAAGGGLLIAAAGAVPAYAAVPHGGHAITITAHHTAGAASGIGPHDVLPCAVKPGAAPASCGGGGDPVSCTMSAGKPSVNFTTGVISANALVQCTEEVASIRLTEHLLQDGVAVSTDSVTELNSPVAITQVSTACRGGNFVNVVDATIVPASGYVLTGGPGNRHFESAPLSVPSFGCSTGGGGCARPASSLAGHPAGRHPDSITCR